MKKFRVRSTHSGSGWVIADADKAADTCEYIGPGPNGVIIGACYWYGTKAEAQAVLDLYLKKQKSTTVTLKDTNPKDALGIKKAPLSTLPTGPMYEVALAMLEGARKYGRHNYRVMGVKASVYYDAAMGHLTSWWEGEDIDSVSGIHHLGHAMACLAVVRDSMMMKNWIDDRPPRYPNSVNLMRNNPLVASILKKYPNYVDPFTEINSPAGTTPGYDGDVQEI